MEIIDITTPLIGCRIFGDDRAPVVTEVRPIDSGYKLSDINMCLHNGTHIDAPSHFLPNGGNVDGIALDKCVGECLVVRHNGDIDGDFVSSLPKASRYLFDGKCLITASGADALVSRGVVMVGIARLSVANPDNSTAVHQALLGAGAVIIESLVLKHVAEGQYTVVALPLNIKGGEASPIRAVLLK